MIIIIENKNATLILHKLAALVTESGHTERWNIAKNYRKYFFHQLLK